VKRKVSVEKESVGIIYQNANGSLYQGNGFEWLKTLAAESVDLIFADPPYNLNKTDWDKFESQEKYLN
jgi:site-specific DNA-methyltransferase (adenine-specific)